MAAGEYVSVSSQTDAEQADIARETRELKETPEAELDEPNPEVVRRAYTTVVELFLGVTPEELNQPKFAGLEELPYPELHEDSVPTLALFRAVCVLPRHAPLRRARL